MIPIYEEPKDMYEHFHAFEHCIFCDKPTSTWHKGTNKPVCKGCAATRKVSEIPKHYPAK